MIRLQETTFKPGPLGLELSGTSSLVGKVQPDSQAEKAEIRSGWIVLRVQGVDVGPSSPGATARERVLSCAQGKEDCAQPWIDAGLVVHGTRYQAGATVSHTCAAPRRATPRHGQTACTARHATA